MKLMKVVKSIGCDGIEVDDAIEIAEKIEI